VGQATHGLAGQHCEDLDKEVKEGEEGEWREGGYRASLVQSSGGSRHAYTYTFADGEAGAKCFRHVRAKFVIPHDFCVRVIKLWVQLGMHR
jgi:hypothetical protein